MSRILILSDLNWTEDSREITLEDVELLRQNHTFPQEFKFNRAKAYAAQILKAKPDIVLFAGDVTGDGSCGHGFHHAFLYLLNMLDLIKIHSFYIQGDHDENQYLDFLAEHTEKIVHAHDISGRAVEVKGLKILGLSFFHTHDKVTLKHLLNTIDNKFDILLCHAELKRRSWLFNLDCKAILTGHFDHKFCAVNEQLFLSFGNDFDFISFAVLNFELEDDVQTIKSGMYGLKSFYNAFSMELEASFEDGKLSFKDPHILLKGKLFDPSNNIDKSIWKTLQKDLEFDEKAIKGTEFAMALEQLLKLKTALRNKEVEWNPDLMYALNKFKVNRKLRVSRTLIKDYLEELAVVVKK